MKHKILVIMLLCTSGLALANERQHPAREWRERSTERQERQNGERNENGARPQGGNGSGQRMSQEERRQLREQIRQHGRDLYRDRERPQPGNGR